MTKYITDKIKCHNCNTEWEHKIYQTVNVSMNPELKEKVFSKEIFLYNCPDCNTKRLVIAPLLYHDMEKNFMILLWPYEWDEIKSNSTIDNILSNAQKTCRRVRTENELIEKIKIFDDWLKDEYIELLKVTIAGNHLKWDNITNLIYLWIDGTELFFNLLFNDWTHEIGSVPMNEYQRYCKETKFEIPSWKCIEMSMYTLIKYIRKPQ